MAMSGDTGEPSRTRPMPQKKLHGVIAAKQMRSFIGCCVALRIIV
jgi:hypothetical protein